MNIARKRQIQVARSYACAAAVRENLAGSFGGRRDFKPIGVPMPFDLHAAAAVKPANLVQTKAFKIDRLVNMVLIQMVFCFA